MLEENCLLIDLLSVYYLFYFRGKGIKVMLGIYRYVLALTVAAGHLWFREMALGGMYAVFCFFLISGYLMSVVLNETYVSRRDTFKYLANRALRIYPPYIVVLILSVLASEQLLESSIQNAFDSVALKFAFPPVSGISQWLANISLLYGLDAQLIVSQAWSLRVELVFYIAMIFMVRSLSVVVLWCVVSFLFALYLAYVDSSFIDRYATVFGASVAFSFGALIYYLNKKFKLRGWHIPVAAFLFLVHLIFSQYIWGFQGRNVAQYFGPGTYGIYVSLLLGGYLLFAIVSNQEQQGPLKSFGKVLGDIAYAIFLLHWLIALLMSASGLPIENSLLFIPANFLVLNIAAIALYMLVEKPINVHFRDRIRPV